MDTLDIKLLKDHSDQYIQLSPFFIFSDTFEFQGYKFKNIYIFLESLKIDSEEDRIKFLTYYLDVDNLKTLFTLEKNKITYSTKFNKKKISTINFNNTSVDIDSNELRTLLTNMIIYISTVNFAFKYALLSSKNINLTFSELDTYTSLNYLTSEQYASLLK